MFVIELEIDIEKVNVKIKNNFFYHEYLLDIYDKSEKFFILKIDIVV